MNQARLAETPDPSPASRPRRRGSRIALGLYALLAIAFLWPLPADPTAYFSDVPVADDIFLFQWNAWWLSSSVALPPTDPLFCPKIFYPVGANLALHTFTPVSLAPVALAHKIAPSLSLVAVGCNLRILLSFVLAGFFVFRLCRRWSGALPSFAAGVLFSFTTYHFNTVPRLHLTMVEVLPLLVLVTLRYRDGPTLKRALAAALCFAVAFYDAPDYFFYASLALAPVVLVFLIRTPIRRWAPSAAAGLAAFALLAAPLIGPRLDAFEKTAFRPTEHDLRGNSLHPADLVVPDRHSVLYGPLTDRRPLTPVARDSGRTLFLGFVPVMMALVFLVRGGRARGPLALLMAVGFGMALGPRLSLGSLEVPMPYGFVEEWVPLLSTSRTPIRFCSLGILATALMAGRAFTILDRPRLRWLAIGLLGLAFAEHIALPRAVKKVRASAAAIELARQPDGPILDIPLSRVNFAHRDQIVHGHPMVFANIPRADRFHTGTLRAEPQCARWVFLDPRREPAGGVTREDRVGPLVRAAGIRSIVLRIKSPWRSRPHVARVIEEITAAGYALRCEDDATMLFVRREPTAD